MCKGVGLGENLSILRDCLAVRGVPLVVGAKNAIKASAVGHNGKKKRPLLNKFKWSSFSP